MSYEVKLKEADIEHVMKGEMSIGIHHGGEEKAMIQYEWTETYFNARFIGHAPSMPIPNHPTAFIRKSIEAISSKKADNHQFPSDVFEDHLIHFDFN